MGLLDRLFKRGQEPSEFSEVRAPNERDDLGRTPLHEAAIAGDADRIKNLLSLGAHPLYQDNQGRTPLEFAGKGTEAEKAMQQSMGPFLHSAADMGNLLEVRALLKNGAPVNFRDEDGNTALHKAAGLGDERMVDTILRYARDPGLQAKNYEGQTAILMATTYSHSDVAKRLIERAGVDDIDAMDQKGRTALIQAVRENNVEVARSLLEMGANPNLKNDQGDTALHAAARIDNPEMVDQLVKHGADLYVRNDRNMTPREIAVVQGFESVAKVFEDYELRAFVGIEGDRSNPIPTVKVPERDLLHAMGVDLRPIVQRDLLDGVKLETHELPEGRFYTGRTLDNELVTLHQGQDGHWKFSVSDGQKRVAGNAVDYMEQVRGMARHEAVYELMAEDLGADKAIKREHALGLPGVPELRMPGTPANPAEPEISL